MSKQKTPTPEKGFFVKLDAEVHRKFKSACVNQGMKMQEAIESMMLEFITLNK